jgi:hypothetical protein
VDECFIGHAKDECSDHVRIHNVVKLIALLGKAADILTQIFSRYLLANFEILGVEKRP